MALRSAFTLTLSAVFWVIPLQSFASPQNFFDSLFGFVDGVIDASATARVHEIGSENGLRIDRMIQANFDGGALPASEKIELNSFPITSVTISLSSSQDNQSFGNCTFQSMDQFQKRNPIMVKALVLNAGRELVDGNIPERLMLFHCQLKSNNPEDATKVDDLRQAQARAEEYATFMQAAILDDAQSDMERVDNGKILWRSGPQSEWHGQWVKFRGRLQLGPLRISEAMYRIIPAEDLAEVAGSFVHSQ